MCGSSTEKHDYFSQNQISVSYDATKLKPFMVYDVSIQTYTRCKGKINRHAPVRTDEAGIQNETAYQIMITDKKA